MPSNKQAYMEAFERAREGKPRPLVDKILAVFTEDQYTRQSREKGERDGMAARAQGVEAPPA
ncbi:MAG TPA: hypothetical protein VF613_20080 [Longimicrobium sp.]|jgi:poly(A) polymerase Pap1